MNNTLLIGSFLVLALVSEAFDKRVRWSLAQKNVKLIAASIISEWLLNQKGP